jgi:hypothetical protein
VAKQLHTARLASEVPPDERYGPRDGGPRLTAISPKRSEPPPVGGAPMQWRRGDMPARALGVSRNNRDEACAP